MLQCHPCFQHFANTFHSWSQLPSSHQLPPQVLFPFCNVVIVVDVVVDDVVVGVVVVDVVIVVDVVVDDVVVLSLVLVAFDWCFEMKSNLVC